MKKRNEPLESAIISHLRTNAPQTYPQIAEAIKKGYAPRTGNWEISHAITTLTRDGLIRLTDTGDGFDLERAT